MAEPEESTRNQEIISTPVYVSDAYKPYGELTAADARGMADQLKGISGGGLDAKVVPVAIAWRELAALLDERGVSTVAELGDEDAVAFSQRVWVVPPGGSLLK